MKKKIYEIYGAKVEVIHMSTAIVRYKVIETGVICKLGRKAWSANAKAI